MTISAPFALRCLPALLLTLGGACGSPASAGAGGSTPSKGETPTKPVVHEPAEAEPKPAEPKPAEPKPAEPDLGAPVLVIDAKQDEAAKPLPDIPVVSCADTKTTPLRCGLAAVCKQLANRWMLQLDVGKSAQAHVAGLKYREGPCPDPVSWTHHDDFTHDVVILEHRLEVLVADEVAELVRRRGSGWRSEARISEVAATGMASQKDHRPVASWQIDTSGDGHEELLLLIRGEDSGHAEDGDPFTRAWVVVCDGAKDECRRLELGEWLEGPREGYATPVQREASWSGVLRIHADPRRSFVIDADDDGHDLETSFDKLPPAESPLIGR